VSLEKEETMDEFDINRVAFLRTNFSGIPKFRNIFNLVLLRLSEERFEELLSLTESVLFLALGYPYASIERLYVTPPRPGVRLWSRSGRRSLSIWEPWRRPGRSYTSCATYCSATERSSFLIATSRSQIARDPLLSSRARRRRRRRISG